MFDTAVRISYSDENVGTIDSVEIPAINNNSSGLREDDLFVMNVGEKIHFFEQEFTDHILLTNKNDYGGKIFDNLSSFIDGAINVPITIKGSNIDQFTLYFDNVEKQWATEIEVNGTTYTNDQWSFTLNNLGELDEINVVLKKWNEKGTYPRLTSIMLGLVVDYKNIKALERSFSGSNNPSIADYGITINGGYVEIQDRGGDIKSLYVSGMLKDGLQIKIVFRQRVIGTFISSNVDYNLDDKIVSFDLVPKLQRLQDEVFVGYSLPKTQSQVITKTARQIFEEIYEDEYEADEETLNVLNSITYTYPIVKTASKYSILFNLLKSCLCVMTENENGVARIEYVG